MDKNLDHIIKTITYLEWPGHDASKRAKKRFWEKLVLSMPKVKPLKDIDGSRANQDTVVHL